MKVKDWPRSMTTVVGEIETVGVSFTATDVGVMGKAVSRFKSVRVTARTQLDVAPLGVYMSVTAPESTNPGHVPEKTDQE